MNLSALLKILPIKKDTDIKELMSKSEKIYTKYGLFFLNRDVKIDQFGFAVLIKKRVGKAVWRNYCKRLIREYMRAHIHIFSRYNRILFLYNYEGAVDYKGLTEEFDNRLQKI